MIEFTADYAGKQAGYKDSFMPDLAAQIVQSGNARYVTGQTQPEEETKVKTPKKAKK